MGVVIRRYIDFLVILLISTSLVLTFLQHHPYFIHSKNVFHSFIHTSVSNWLMAVPMTIRLVLGTHVSPTITSDSATLHVCKQQIASGNKLLFMIL